MWIFKMILSPLPLYIMVFVVTHVFATWQQRGNDIMVFATSQQSPSYSLSSNSDGTIVAIGDHTNNVYTGQVSIWVYGQGIWTRKGDDINGENEGDLSGQRLTLSKDGNVIAIGAPGKDLITGTGSTIHAGYTRIFKYDGSAWTQRGSAIYGEAQEDRCGFSVALSDNGDVIAIGAPQTLSLTGHGYVRVYGFNDTSWQQRGSTIDGEAIGDASGHSVALSSDGNVVAIGAFRNSKSGDRAGHVRVYEFLSDQWGQRGDDIGGEMTAEFLGWSVSMSSDGNIVAIGAPAIEVGHVRVFNYSGSTWRQRGSDIDDKLQDDGIGRSVSLNSDGNTVAVGSGGNGRGFARVYAYNGSGWQQRGDDIAPSTTSNGHIVSLSSDGNAVAVGLPDAGVPGVVSVFEYPTTPSPT
eukprot:637203_1